MPAISTQNVGEGFVRGYKAVDDSITNRRNLDLKEKANADQNAYRDRQETRQGESDRATADYRQAQLDASTDRAVATEAHRTALQKDSAKRTAITESTYKDNKRKDVLAGIKQRAGINVESALLTGNVDWELEKEIAEFGPEASNFSISKILDKQTNQNVLRSREIIEGLSKGDLGVVNKPHNLDVLHDIYKDEIQAGLESEADFGDRAIIGKKLAGFEVGPNGAVVANLRVTYANGDSAVKPITINRSSNPEDGVKLLDAGMMIDDLKGKWTIANVLKNNPEARKNAEKVNQLIYGQVNAGDGSSRTREAMWLANSARSKEELEAYDKTFADSKKRMTKAQYVRERLAKKSDLEEVTIESLGAEYDAIQNLENKGGGGQKYRGPDPKAIQRLKDNPSLREDFKQHFNLDDAAVDSLL